MNDVKRIRMLRFSVSAIAEGATGSSGLTSLSSLNTDSKQLAQRPLALTGVAHLLYLVPQLLQMAIVVSVDREHRLENVRLADRGCQAKKLF
jgi:hypothetical protein